MPADTDNPFLLRNTVFAVAWGMLTMDTRERRVWAKRRVMTYATMQGYALSLHQMQRDEEVWALYRIGEAPPIRTGTLAECCRWSIENEDMEGNIVAA